MITPPTNTFMTLQRIASMTILSLQRFIKGIAGQLWPGFRTIPGIVACSCFLAGCSNSEEPIADGGSRDQSSPMMIPVASEISGVEAPTSVSISPEVVGKSTVPQRSPPDATLTPIQRPKIALSESMVAVAPEPKLQVGDPAPALRVQHWVRDRATRSEDQSTQVKVVTFWATWSESSVEALARLPLLQHRFGDEIELMAISSETPEAVHGFLNSPKPESVKRWRDHLTFAMAADHRGESEDMFLLAGYEQSLPTTFVINREGIIAWIGPADQCEPVVARVLTDDWDVAAARKQHQWAQRRKSAQRDIRDRLALARVSNDGEECLRLIDGLLERFPNDVEFQMLRLQYQLRFEMVEAANAQSAFLLQQLQDDSLRLNQLAWTLAEHSSISGLDLSVALSAAERAVDLTNEADASSLETLARVQFRRGDTATAIETQSLAIKLAPDNKNMAETLEAFRKSSPSPVRKVGFYGSLM